MKWIAIGLILFATGCAGLSGPVSESDRVLLGEIATVAIATYAESPMLAGVVGDIVAGNDDLVTTSELSAAIAEVNDKTGGGMTPGEQTGLVGLAVAAYTLARNRGWLGSSSRAGAAAT